MFHSAVNEILCCLILSRLMLCMPISCSATARCVLVFCLMTAKDECDFCSQFHSDTIPQSLSKGKSIGLTLAAICGVSSVAILTISWPFLSPGLRKVCLPFVPATEAQVANVLTALKSSSGSLLDCGSGDGRIVFAAARAGFKAVGVELNYWLVLYSKMRASLLGLSKTAKFERKDLFQVDFSKYDNVVVFGVDCLMPELEKMFHLHARDNPFNVVACRFPLPNTTPVHVVGQGIDTVWLYNFSAKKQ